jgi:1-aminocyclopropane-1-carboxylate deaminase
MKGEHVTLQDFPRYPLTFGPSPVHRLDRLTTHLGGATVWAKREDCNSGLAFGGNKIRKLEYVVPDALAKGADTLVNDRVGNILLSRIMGADVRLDPAGFDIGIRSSWEEALREVEEAGGIPYGIPAGASEHPLGGLGFANWAFEVAEQEQQLGVFFDTIIVCTVTGSTHAGMIAGFAALDQQTKGRPRRVLGIDASATIEKTRDQVARIARNTGKLIELGRDLTDEEIIVLEGWAGDFYGIPVESTIEAIKLSGSLEGMIIDPVYEGKSMAGLIDLVSSGEIPKGSTVLYAHLGGQPALNAYAGIF